MQRAEEEKKQFHMDGFNFRRLLLSTSFWFLLSFEIHYSQKFYEGLRVETELSVLSLQREKKPFRLRSSSEPLRISQKRNLLSSLGNVLSIFLFNTGKVETFRLLLHFISFLYPNYHNTKATYYIILPILL